MSPLLSTTDLLQFMTLIRDSRHVAICGHRGPDGDAMGSALAWSAYLQGLGKQVSVDLALVNWNGNGYQAGIFTISDGKTTIVTPVA